MKRIWRVPRSARNVFSPLISMASNTMSVQQLAEMMEYSGAQRNWIKMDKYQRIKLESAILTAKFILNSKVKTLFIDFQD